MIPTQLLTRKQTLPTLNKEKPSQCDVSYTVREAMNVGDALLDLAESKKINLLFVGAAGKSARCEVFLRQHLTLPP